MLGVWSGILIPLIGTTLGSACVFFMSGKTNIKVQKGLSGFAAGVMVAASIWSLIIPAINQSEDLGGFAFVPAVIGFWLGVLFLLLLDKIIPHLHPNSENSEGPKTKLKKSSMLVLAVVLHNLPEGMAVGVVFAGLISGDTTITLAGAMALSIGIAIQNFPEGAIISMPLASNGKKKSIAFFQGFISGVVELLGAVVTLLAASIILPALPYFLSFAAGAMIYVVVEELIPQMAEGKHSDVGTIMFAVGFSMMMTLDVALG